MKHTPQLALTLCLIALTACESLPQASPTPTPPQRTIARPVVAPALANPPRDTPSAPAPSADASPARPTAQTLLDAAQRDYDANPTDETAIIWLARRLGYVGRHDDAINVLTKGLASNPGSYRILRHRGHRYITTRQFELAIADLSFAASLCIPAPDSDALPSDEVEPDGLPNELDVPRSTTRFNILYHLALAQYLSGKFDDAAKTWGRCLTYARRNDDMTVATLNWLNLTLRRLTADVEADVLIARIHPHLCVIEDGAYLDLLLLHKTDDPALADRLLAPDAHSPGANPNTAPLNNATIAYGVAMWHLLQGHTDTARDILQRTVDSANPAAFGAIAAEIELASITSRQ